MADSTTDGLTAILAESVDSTNDKIPIWDASAGKLKYITPTEILSLFSFPT